MRMPENEPTPEQVLRNAAPGTAVQRRIVEGALQRSAEPQRSRVWVPVVAMAAVAVLAVVAVLWRSSGAPKGLQTRAVAEAMEQPLTLGAARHEIPVQPHSQPRARRGGAD